MLHLSQFRLKLGEKFISRQISYLRHDVCFHDENRKMSINATKNTLEHGHRMEGQCKRGSLIERQEDKL